MIVDPEVYTKPLTVISRLLKGESISIPRDINKSVLFKKIAGAI